MNFTKIVALQNRPHVITADAAKAYALRIQEYDARAFERRSGPFAALRKLGVFQGKQKPAVMEDDDYGRREPMTRPAVYQPTWLGAPEAIGEWGWVLHEGIGIINIDSPLVENGGEVCGVWLHGYDTILAACQEMDTDDRVKGVMARWECPGGVVAPGLDDLTAYLQDRRSPTAKPLWSYCNTCCSGAYWLGAQADKMVAPSAGVVGSIGAIMVHTSVAGALAKDGIEVTAIQFGEHKSDGAYFKPLSDEARATAQSMIDEIGENFLAAVAAGRGDRFSAEQARATQAQIYFAENRDASLSGLALGLVDAVMPEHEAFAALKAQLANPISIPTSSPAIAASATHPAMVAGKKAARAAQPTKETTMLKPQASITPPARRAAVEPAPVSDSPNGDANDTPTDDELKEKCRTLLQEDDDAGNPEGPFKAALRKTIADDDAADASEGGDKPAEGEDAPAADAKTELARAKAIMALPEAKGREALAQELAFDASVTVERAKAILAKGGKISTLSDRMKDPKLSGDGGKADTRSEAKRQADEMLVYAGLKKPA